jgi:DNA-binding response OmpR family regulator
MPERSIRAMVIDKDPDSRLLMEETLREGGHHVTTVASKDEALAWLRETYFDLVILDPRLNESMDGLKVLRAIRWRWPRTAIIVTVAPHSLEDAVRSVHGRADAYLVKPVDPEELAEAMQDVFVQFQVRCADDAEQNILVEAGIVLNRQRREVTLNGDRLDLTPTEFEILLYLLESAHRVVPADELARVILGRDDLEHGRRMVRWHIHHLRRKLEPTPSDPHYIVNVYGEGYTVDGDEVGESQ